jgi:hypothetical protein
MIYNAAGWMEGQGTGDRAGRGVVAGGSLGTGCWAADDGLGVGVGERRSADQLGTTPALGTLGYNP